MSEEARRTPGAAVAAWWRALHPDEEGRRGDRAAAARLRRAATPNEVLVVPAALDLYSRVSEALEAERLSERQTQGVAILAGVLAGAKPGGADYTRFATMLGRTGDGRRPGEGARARYSPLRFAALVRAEDAGERLRNLRHAFAVARNARFDVARFADDVLRWEDATRRQWIFDYHQQGRAAPQDARADLEGETAQ